MSRTYSIPRDRFLEQFKSLLQTDKRIDESKMCYVTCYKNNPKMLRINIILMIILILIMILIIDSYSYVHTRHLCVGKHRTFSHPINSFYFGWRREVNCSRNPSQGNYSFLTLVVTIHYCVRDCFIWGYTNMF